MTKGIIRTSLLFLALFAAVAHARADERILDFHSNIKIKKSGDMTVHETITVQAEGQRIRHGIYRDFPTDRKRNSQRRSAVI